MFSQVNMWLSHHKVRPIILRDIHEVAIAASACIVPHCSVQHDNIIIATCNDMCVNFVNPAYVLLTISQALTGNDS